MGKLSISKNSVADRLSRIPLNATHVSSSTVEAEKLALPILSDGTAGGKIALIFYTCNKNNIEVQCTSINALTSSGIEAEPLVLSISADRNLLAEIKRGYLDDPFITSLKSAVPGISFISERDGFWFVGK